MIGAWLGENHICTDSFSVFLSLNIPFPGMELAGVIEDIGPSVQKHKIGDHVFGDISNHGFGTFTEYICVDENAVLTKPPELSFEEAAAIPHASALALQALKQTGGIQENQKILINGGGGGVGTIALQLAKLHNCHVTGVDSHEKLEMMKSLGFDSVLDYKLTDFTKTGARYDLILDCKTNKSAFSYVKALKSTSKYVTIGGEPWSLIKILFWGKLISLFSSKKLQILSLSPNEDLDYICNLVKQDKIKCEIDGPHKLEDTAKLIQYFGEGKHKGKVVIQIN